MVEVECHLVIKRNGSCFLDANKTDLLYEIKRRGSLNSAATQLNISYQHAWNMVNEMNDSASEPIVIKQRGGANGGGAEISNYGERILKEYYMITEKINKLVSQINIEISL